MKLVTWNVNGIRSVWNKGFLDWFSTEKPDLLCLQEIKIQDHQLTEEQRHPKKYHSVFHFAEKPGYSGTAIYSKTEPLNVEVGIGDKQIDFEGRVLAAEFANFIVVNTYFPNSRRDLSRLKEKLYFCEKLHAFLDKKVKKGKNILLCGDMNIAHNEIDLKNPKSNQKNAGFLPEERAWMSHFLSSGYTDTFRRFNQEPNHYTWWSNRPGVREKNIGWRLDYFISNNEFNDRLKSVFHKPEVKGSDHCPVELRIQS